ncbi:MAG: signal peptidase II [Oscillospiraceae bacterium]|nr:signal peptidase II [Oscillospiraceae bacterium]
MLYLIAVILLVALDQVVKALVRGLIPLGTSVSFIPHILNLTYIRNTGAAFSSLEGKTFFLGIVSALVSLVLIYMLAKPVVRHPVGRWIVTVVLAGALGNMIDRFFLGYVTDMFQTVFINFAVFNVADIYVVLGVIALAVYGVFFWDRLEPKKDAATEKAPEVEPEEKP